MANTVTHRFTLNRDITRPAKQLTGRPGNYRTINERIGEEAVVVEITVDWDQLVRHFGYKIRRGQKQSQILGPTIVAKVIKRTKVSP